MEVSVSRPPLIPHYVEYNKHLDQTVTIFQRLVSSSHLLIRFLAFHLDHILILLLFYGLAEQDPSKVEDPSGNRSTALGRVSHFAGRRVQSCRPVVDRLRWDLDVGEVR